MQICLPVRVMKEVEGDLTSPAGDGGESGRRSPAEVRNPPLIGKAENGEKSGAKTGRQVIEAAIDITPATNDSSQQRLRHRINY